MTLSNEARVAMLAARSAVADGRHVGPNTVAVLLAALERLEPVVDVDEVRVLPPDAVADDGNCVECGQFFPHLGTCSRSLMRSGVAWLPPRLVNEARLAGLLVDLPRLVEEAGLAEAPLAQPQPDEAAEIRAALVRQDEAKWKLVHAVGGDAELARAAGEYLDATDALYRSQINVPRVFA